MEDGEATSSLVIKCYCIIVGHTLGHTVGGSTELV